MLNYVKITYITAFLLFITPSSIEVQAKWLESYTGELKEQKLIHLFGPFPARGLVIVNSLSLRRLQQKNVISSIWPTNRLVIFVIQPRNVIQKQSFKIQAEA